MMKYFSLLFAAALFLSCGGGDNTGTPNQQNQPAARASETDNPAAATNPTETSAGNETSSAEGEFILYGVIKNAPNQQVMLDKYSLTQNQQASGTAMTGTDGSFTLKGKINEKGFYLIRMQNSANWLVILDKGKYNFSADANDIYNYTIEGSPEAKAFAAFIIKTGQSQAALNQLSQQYNQARMTGDINKLQAIQQQYQTTYTAYQAAVRATADRWEHPLQSVFAASMLNAEENADYLEKFITSAQQKLPGSTYVAELKQKVDGVTRLAIGRVAPDITLKSPKGENIKLSSTRGKVVLLDFWASWCRPCRNENPNVVRLYDKYQSKGFDVFSVSLDQNMDKWVGAIKADNLKWGWHGSTLQGWQCPVAQTYEVRSIPQALLLDRDGKIIAKNLRGEELANKLREIFGS